MTSITITSHPTQSLRSLVCLSIAAVAKVRTLGVPIEYRVQWHVVNVPVLAEDTEESLAQRVHERTEQMATAGKGGA